MSTNHEVIESRSPYRGSFFSVQVDRIRLPNGREATREIVRHPGAAAVVPLKDGAVLLVRQNRHAVGSDLLEIPAGKLDVPGEGPADCARRELKEILQNASRPTAQASEEEVSSITLARRFEQTWLS